MLPVMGGWEITKEAGVRDLFICRPTSWLDIYTRQIQPARNTLEERWERQRLVQHAHICCMFAGAMRWKYARCAVGVR